MEHFDSNCQCILSSRRCDETKFGSDETGCQGTTTSMLVLGDVPKCLTIAYIPLHVDQAILFCYVYCSQSQAMKIAWACQATHAGELQSLTGGYTCIFNTLSVKLVLVLVTSIVSRARGWRARLGY